MKLRTHIASALIIALAADHLSVTMVEGYRGEYIIRSVWFILAAITQCLIDSVGHSWVVVRRIRIPRRNRVHSLPVMLLMGLGLGALFYYFTGSQVLLVASVAITLIHWLEDLFTEGGVYLGKRRLRLPLSAKYDSALANRVALILLLPAFTYVSPFIGIYEFITTTLVLLYVTIAFLSP